MKKSMFSLLTLAVVLLSAFAPPAKNYTVDAAASDLKWTGYHLAKSYEHTGKIGLKSGSLAVENGLITGGEFVIDMNTITCTDIPDEKKNGNLVKHLKSPDFFDVATNPEAKLVIKKSEKSQNGLKVTADITIRGITKPIEFEAKLTEKGDTVEALADIKVKRSEHNVLYGWTLENAVISGEFLLQAKLVAKK